MRNNELREDRIRVDNELDINNIRVTLISTTNPEMKCFENKSGYLLLNNNIKQDTVFFTFSSMYSSYLIEVLETCTNITFTTRNSTYIFKKDVPCTNI